MLFSTAFTCVQIIFPQLLITTPSQHLKKYRKLKADTGFKQIVLSKLSRRKLLIFETRTLFLHVMPTKIHAV